MRKEPAIYEHIAIRKSCHNCGLRGRCKKRMQWKKAEAWYWRRKETAITTTSRWLRQTRLPLSLGWAGTLILCLAAYGNQGQVKCATESESRWLKRKLADVCNDAFNPANKWKTQK
jgi:hypothetical protein